MADVHGRDDGRHDRLEVRIIEQRKGQPRPAAAVQHPVRGRDEPAAAQALEHVADVADQGSRNGRRLQPALVGAHLQAAVLVLGQQGQEAVVGMFADAPAARFGGRIAEDAEQHRRTGQENLGEVIGRQAQGQGDPAQDRLGRAHRSRHVGLNSRAQRRRAGGPEVRPVHRPAGRDPRILRRQFLAEIDPLLLVGESRSELAAEGEPAAPGRTGLRHGDLGLLRFGQGEKGPRGRVQRPDHVVRDAMAGDVEEPVARRGLADL